MNNITQVAKDAIKALFLKAGISIAKSNRNIIVSKTKYGILPWNDIQQLAGDLNIKIDVCFDVGANDGETAICLLDKFSLSRVFAFEPHPLTFLELKDKIKNQRLFPYQLALSDKEGERRFYVYDEHTVNSLAPNARYVERFERKSSEITVKSTTIDSFCAKENVEKIDILKIDTEGFDLFVLKGAERMLSSGNIRFVFAEFNDCLEKHGVTGGALNQISDYLARFNFHFVATYTEYIVTKGELFVVANLLMIRCD